jgi:hypothetical protein
VKGTDAKEACNRINSKLAIVDREYVIKELSHKLYSVKQKYSYFGIFFTSKAFVTHYFIGFESILDWSDSGHGGKELSSNMWAIGYPKIYSGPAIQAVLSTFSAKLTNTQPSTKYDGAICKKYEGKRILNNFFRARSMDKLIL